MEASFVFWASLLAPFPFFLMSLSSQSFPLQPGWNFSPDLSLSSSIARNAHRAAPFASLFAPILTSSNFSSGKGFALGLLSLFDAPTSAPRRIFLTVCLGTNRTDARGQPFAVPVWSLNRGKPLAQVERGRVSLEVSSRRELVLKDGDGVEVWKLSRAGAMVMQDDGNLVIYSTGKANPGIDGNGDGDSVVWQSFNYPTDTLVTGQTLPVGSKIVSNNLLFTAQMFPGGLVFFMASVPSVRLPYWLVTINSTWIVYFAHHDYFDLSKDSPVNITAIMLSSPCSPSPSVAADPHTFFKFDGDSLTVQAGCTKFQWHDFTNTYLNSSYSSDFFQIGDDGYPRGYTYLRQDQAHHLLFPHPAPSTCITPNACGAYGICSEYALGTQRTCKCPSSQDSPNLAGAFAPITPSDPSQGCRRMKPLTCGANQSMVEIKQATLISIRSFFETSIFQRTLPLHECTDICLSNCSCSGVFYHYGSSFCLPFGEGTGISNVSLVNVPSPEYSAFLKIYTPPSNVADMIEKAELPETAATSHLKRLILPVASAAFVIIICVSVLAVRRYSWLLMRMRPRKDVNSDTFDEDEELEAVMPFLPTRYSYKDLQEVTNGFKKELGRGGFGCVYEGVLSDGRRVGVKKLDSICPRHKQFLTEVATMGGISHHNVVRLYGFCSERLNRLLVYEYMENRSLDLWLFPDKENNNRLLKWSTRFEVALGTARGLLYLHKDCPQPIIHFDIKPQNILLDNDFVPKLSDFGLSKFVGREASMVMTAVRGTPGYLAPEWLSHSVVSNKCDVYSYGMVLFELVGGRRNAVQSMEGSDEWFFPMWAALKCRERRMYELVDRRLRGVFDAEQVKRMLHVAFMCIQKDPKARPSMGDVCQVLEGNMELDEELPFSVALESHLFGDVPPFVTSTSTSITSAISGLEGR